MVFFFPILNIKDSILILEKDYVYVCPIQTLIFGRKKRKKKKREKEREL